jgi:hypothetical protein
VALGWQKPKESGYSHELWTTRLLAAHARDRGLAAGHPSLAKLAQGTVCKILADHAVKPHKMRYHLEKRDPELSPRWRKSCASIAKSRCCASRDRAWRAPRRARTEARPSSPTTRSLVFRRSARRHQISRRCLVAAPTVMRNHEYKRHGPLTAVPPSRRSITRDARIVSRIFAAAPGERARLAGFSRTCLGLFWCIALLYPASDSSGLKPSRRWTAFGRQSGRTTDRVMVR